ncbi:hypothetical protein [Acinetobacter phage Ab69]|nr:hypothetical protein [Acinetobacter phage Ab69]
MWIGKHKSRLTLCQLEQPHRYMSLQCLNQQ